MTTLQITPSDLLTTADIATTFGISRGSVVSAIDKGRLPAARIGAGKGVYVARYTDAARLWGGRSRRA